MKTDLVDILMSSSALTLLVLMASGVTWLVAGDYPWHFVVEVLVFLLAYGIFTGLLLALIRRFHPYPVGEHAMDTVAFRHWKLAAVLADLAQKTLSPFRTVFTEPLLMQLLGARIGANVAIAGVIRDHPLITLDAFATIGQNSVITAHAITHDRIVLKPVRIGRNSVVGINCVVMPGVTLEENAVLAPGAVALMDTYIPANELWGGVPARRLKTLEAGDGS